MSLSGGRVNGNIILIELLLPRSRAPPDAGGPGRGNGRDGHRRMAESIEHKGYSIILLRRAPGWRIYIRPPDAAMTRAEVREALSREQALAAATRLVEDAIAASRPSRGRR